MKIRISLLFLMLIFFAGTAFARTSIENLAQVEKLFMEGKYERVVTEATRLIDAGSHGREELFYLKGLSQTQLGNYSLARKTFEYMIERYPRGKRPFDGYIGIGDAYFLEGKAAESITNYNEALASYPDHKNSSIAYYKIGTAYQKLGNANRAREYFDRVKDSSPLSFESTMMPEPEVKETPKTADTADRAETADYYYVQVGYFKSKYNAERLTEKLRKKGYSSHMSTQMKSGLTFYRVKVGRFKTKPEAEDMAGRLKSDGYKTKVCR